jgi:hypothetical protein
MSQWSLMRKHLVPRKRLTKDNYQFSPDDKSAPVVLAAHRPPPMEFKCSQITIYFAHWYGKGLDEIVKQMHAVLWERHRNPQRHSARTIENDWKSIDGNFMLFLAEMRTAYGRDIALSNIDKSFMRAFIDWLRHRPARSKSGYLSFGAQRKNYTSCKSVLNMLCQRRILPPGNEIFPKNPYPNANRRRTSYKPYSTAERDRLLQALWSDLVAWRTGGLKLGMRTVFTILILLIAARCGRNTTPLLMLTIHSLRDHPLKPDRRLLVTYKRRGYTTHVQSFSRDAEQIEGIITIRLDVAGLFKLACDITVPFRENAPTAMRDALWLWQSESPSMRNKYVLMTEHALFDSISSWSQRHNLRADDGSRLQVSVSRLRKTFERRIWEITDGNLFATAVLGGHTASVADAYYLEAPPEAERNFKWCGEAWVDQLRGVGDSGAGKSSFHIVPTPVAHCRDSLYGKYAPKNGHEHCSSFLTCFRCPSQIVTLDDLWRLMSFYWLLARERGVIPRRQWSKFYAHVIQEIDTSILPIFERDHKEKVKAARERARTDPHPMWRDRRMLSGEPTGAEGLQA